MEIYIQPGRLDLEGGQCSVRTGFYWFNIFMIINDFGIVYKYGCC